MRYSSIRPSSVRLCARAGPATSISPSRSAFSSRIAPVRLGLQVERLEARMVLGVGALQLDPAARLLAHVADVDLVGVAGARLAAVIVDGRGQEMDLQVRMLVARL